MSASSLSREIANNASNGEVDTQDAQEPSPDRNRPKRRFSNQNKENNDPEGANSKKPKYRIHIPKNSEMPEDTFYSQPPPTVSSPYRIDKFQWRKPGSKTSPPPTPVDSEPKPLIVKSTFQTPAATLSEPISHGLAENRKFKGHGLMSRSPTRNYVHALNSESLSASNTCQKPTTHSASRRDNNGSEDFLADLPSDAFSSPELPSMSNADQPIATLSRSFDTNASLSPQTQHQRLVAPRANLRQTTLFGDQALENGTQSVSKRKPNWPLANREEPSTHHKLQAECLRTWVYPMNLGTIRDYQYSIVAKGLFNNMLVALPTGLGKTFIAATIMLNWFRWTVDAQIVFVAPTKPLVSQQVKACFDIAGIPRSSTTMLTGETTPGIRAEEWLTKRVFFMTPQTFINDLKTGICDPKRLVLVVVDEAHRATGGYAYVEVVRFLRRFNTSFRVLALTATPGSSIESVQEVIDGLGISRIEIRTEESLDIRQYVHARKINTILFENSDEMAMVIDLFSRSLQPLVDKLCGLNAYWGKDPMSLTPYGCNQARSRWMASDAGRKAPHALKNMVNSVFSILASLAHGIELLKFHGIGPFYHKVLAFRNELEAGNTSGKYRKQVVESEPFRTMMSRIRPWINNPNFVGHPKLEYLQRVVLNHFLDAGEGRGHSNSSRTRIMVFSHYRDSAEEIARVLLRNEPMVRPRVFVGQAASKGSDGMDQKTQLDVIQKFRNGTFNTLVATSIGEEGLDIGEIDLIVCYDASASPVRMLQRMGRTGRKRAGNIVVTLMKGKEENNFIKAKDNYEKMQAEIASGTKFNFHDESRRIIPKDIQPAVEKKVIDIPLENTQAELPEPRKRAKPPKRPPKKFHMPDVEEKGFVKASRLRAGIRSDEGDVSLSTTTAKPLAALEPIPPLDDVLLTRADQRDLERRYLDIKGDTPEIVDVPHLDRFPSLQRLRRPTRFVEHGRMTKRAISMLMNIHELTEADHLDYETQLTLEDRQVGVLQAAKRASFLKTSRIHKSRLPTASLVPRSSERQISQTPSLVQEWNLNSDDNDASSSESICEAGEVVASGTSLPVSGLHDLQRKMSLRESQREHSQYDLRIEEDLPDLNSLVEGNRRGSNRLAGTTLNDRQSSINPRKRRRVVIDDDSDK
ncbi:MAG: hypothetical protein LQ342_002605 [Letrouitia transgressa]|nr:MAG: hypothetical protein LQ342_002605 [Letrouitia transgressa]